MLKINLNYSLWVIALIAIFTFSACTENESEEPTAALIEAEGEGAANWSSCNDWAGITYGKYHYRNNTWGTHRSGASWQCVWANNKGNWGGNSGHSNSTGLVKGWPQIVVGWAQSNGWNLNSNRGNMGKKWGQYNNLKCYWKFSSPQSGSARYISLIDVYTHWTNNPGGSTKAATNLQIYTHLRDPSGWLNNNIYGTYQGQKTIDGITYKMWFESPHPDGAADDLVHVRPTSWKKNATHNIKKIIQWAKDKGKMGNNEHVTGIHAGWEFIDGNNGADFITTGYNITAN